MSLTILLDTNILIEREDNKKINENIQNLLQVIQDNNIKIFIHECTFKDIEHDKNLKRKEIISSKLKSYSILNSKYNFEEDELFLSFLNFNKGNLNDFVDNSLLYSVYKNEVSFLVTEDKGIHQKANRLNILEENFSERIFNVHDALNYFKTDVPSLPYMINHTTVNYLNIEDSIFDTLKQDYAEFVEWFENKQKEHRECLVYYENENKIGALLIYKTEKETIFLKNEKLPPKNRIKIATMVVQSNGYKIGELFLSWIIKYSLQNKADEIYLTHFVKGNDDPLVYLIQEYGFECKGYNPINEAVFIKELNSSFVKKEINSDLSKLSYLAISKKYYPYFYDGADVKKFIVPIIPKYHQKLFLPDSSQTYLDNYVPNNSYNKPITSINTIKKAYLSQSNIKSLNEGDILLFYESSKKGISEIGVVEKFFKDISIGDINIQVGKRSVYSQEELEKYEGNNVVILFIHSRSCKKISFNDLKRNHILKTAPQSIQFISQDNYSKLKELMLK